MRSSLTSMREALRRTRNTGAALMSSAYSRQSARELPISDRAVEAKGEPDLLTSVDLKHSDDLFTYTRGRFICNETYEMWQRRVHFNVNELGRCAAEAVGSASCVKIEKYPDGTYSKAMLLTMDDGAQVVAKIPNPNAGLPHFTTASEVATMDFVGPHTWLGINAHS